MSERPPGTALKHVSWIFSGIGVALVLSIWSILNRVYGVTPEKVLLAIQSTAATSWHLVTDPVPVGPWVIFSAFVVGVAATLMVVLAIYLRERPPAPPAYTAYTSDTFGEILYHWRWTESFDGYTLENLTEFCPACVCRLVNGRCPSCGAFPRRGPSDSEVRALVDMQARQRA